jgi:hypothetical protein
LKDVKFPDGTIIKNVPDNLSKAEITAKLEANGYDMEKLLTPKSEETPPPEAQVESSVPSTVEPTPEQAPEKSMMDEAGRQVALTGASALRGVTSPLTLVGDGLNSVVNLGLQGLGVDYQLPLASQVVRDASETIAKPENAQERIVGDVTDTIASLITTGGVAKAAEFLSKGLGAAGKTTEGASKVADFLSKGFGAPGKSLATSLRGISPNQALDVTKSMGASLGKQATTAVAATGAASATQELTDNTGLGLAAGVVAGVLTGKAPTKNITKTIEEARNAASALYDRVANSKLRFESFAGQDFNKSIINALDEKTLPLDGEGMATVRSVLKTWKKGLKNPEGVELASFERLRKEANNMITNAGGNHNQRMAGYAIKNTVDDFLGAVTTKMVKSGDKEGVELLVEGRKTFRTASKASVLETVLLEAKHQSEVTPNLSYADALQREMVKLAKNQKKLKTNFSGEEIARLKDISKGGKGLQTLVNVLGTASGILGKGVAIFNAPGTMGLSLAGIPVASAAKSAAKNLGSRVRERGINSEIQNILGGANPATISNPNIVAGMFGLNNVDR